MSLIEQLQNLRALFRDATPTDPKVINDYAWLMVKLLNAQVETLGSVHSRQILADYLKLPVQRPSQLHSALLSAAIKVASVYHDFRFASFLRMWDVGNLRPEDKERQRSQDGRTFPSLAERTAKALGHSLLLHPEEGNSIAESGLRSFLADHGLAVFPMLVTRIKEAMGKDNRKYIFVTLTSPEGVEVETIAHNLQVSPLHPLPEGKRHYVNIGQLYDVLLREKSGQADDASLSVSCAYLSQNLPQHVFPSPIGFVDHIDQKYSHMHIYDAQSRHFVAHIQRFSREKEGDFVRFIPVTPRASKFKTAIILSIIPATAQEVQSILREIRITTVNTEKNYASWELTDKSTPIIETLSPLQLSRGEQSPSFTQGYLPLTTSSLSPATTLRALIYLKRGKDGTKRPYVARIDDSGDKLQ